MTPGGHQENCRHIVQFNKAATARVNKQSLCSMGKIPLGNWKGYHDDYIFIQSKLQCYSLIISPPLYNYTSLKVGVWRHLVDIKRSSKPPLLNSALVNTCLFSWGVDLFRSTPHYVQNICLLISSLRPQYGEKVDEGWAKTERERSEGLTGGLSTTMPARSWDCGPADIMSKRFCSRIWNRPKGRMQTWREHN